LFADQERHAFDLGHRMAGAGFTLDDDLFAHLHPRFALQWTRGFLGWSAIARITATWSRDVSASPARV
jgi:hypothetical protein